MVILIPIEIFRFTSDKTNIGCHAHVGLRGHDANRTCLSETSMAPVLKTEKFNREEYRKTEAKQDGKPMSIFVALQNDFDGHRQRHTQLFVFHMFL